MKFTKYYRLKRLFGRNVRPPTGKVRFGDMERVRPFCQTYGLSRGTAVDRVFIERFLTENGEFIRGQVLEVRNNDYTVRFGGEKVTISDVLDIDPANENATIVDDLRTLKFVEDETYDCVILTQTLHVIDDDVAVVRNLHRVLKAGGKLLLTVPCISWVPRRAHEGVWHRFYTDNGLAYLLGKHFQPSSFDITIHGNLFAATAFLYGLAAEDLKSKWFEENDPAYPVIIAVVATKEGNP